jgi:hypothetical protein
VSYLEDARKQRKALMALLGKDNLIEYAIERWAEITNVEDEPAGDEETGSSSQLVNDDEKEPEETSHFDPWQDIEAICLDLSNLLPAIRSARHSILFDINTAIGEQSAIGVLSKASTQSSMTELSGTTLDLGIERNLRLAASLEEALRNDEAFAKEHGIKDILPHSSSLQKHLKQLKNIQLRVVRNPKSHPSAEEAGAVVKLNNALQEATKSLMISPETRKNVKVGTNSEKTIEDLLGVFQSTNSVLLQA